MSNHKSVIEIIHITLLTNELTYYNCLIHYCQKFGKHFYFMLMTSVIAPGGLDDKVVCCSVTWLVS